MMRSWGSRNDTIVCDEPFYAYFLQQTQLVHPGAAETIANHETDWRKIVASLTGPISDSKEIYYQKQMAHHLVGDVELEWLSSVTNCFLIRQPSEMITSLIKFLPEPTLDDTGLPQQVEIFELVRDAHGDPAPVLDAREVLTNPRGILNRLCKALGLEFTDAMLSWQPGFRDTDGVWAKHWYKKIEQTTSFAPYRAKAEFVPQNLMPLLKQCDELYDYLYQFRLQA